MPLNDLKQTIGAKKATPKDGFGNAFGNKGVVSLQTPCNTY
jgi:hypothetical protein